MDVGFNDAENYRRRENKGLLNRVFIKSSAPDKLCENESFFLIGDKGTGKTACAVFLSNNFYKNTVCRLNYIRETEYQSFVLKGRNSFDYPEYVKAFTLFSEFVRKNRLSKPDFVASADVFLQFLYQTNILSFSEEQEGERIRRWCFRERTYSNVSPKVRTHEKYDIHYGLSKALNLGRKVLTRR